jgi:hypothetical protein
MAQSAVWAAPATLATIASFGGAAAAAPAEIAGSIGMTEALSLASASEGGYFPGDPTKVAGVFHGGEVVFSAPAVQNIGAENLLAMHKAALTPGSPPIAAASAGGRSAKQPMTLFVDHREQDMIDRVLSDPRFETRVVRIGRGNRGQFGSQV